MPTNINDLKPGDILQYEDTKYLLEVIKLGPMCELHYVQTPTNDKTNLGTIDEWTQCFIEHCFMKISI